MLAVSFSFFGLVLGVPVARLETWWSVLLTALIGALAGLAFAEHGIRVSRSTASASPDEAEP